MSIFTENQKAVLFVVYFSILLDNILLTVVVPIVPDYLISLESLIKHLGSAVEETNRTDQVYEQQLGEENSRVGMLLSSKALVQLVFNPIVGCAARYVGYTLPLLFGTVNLLASSLLFALGESYISLFFARSLQGLASACIGVSGMCLVAEQYPEEADRSRVMGVVLGSVALGVLLGYPYGGFAYAFLGKAAPFLGVAFLAILDIAFQLAFLNMKQVTIERPGSGGICSGWSSLLTDRRILLAAGAVWLSSSAMAVLEPCLPLWLMANIKPKRWQFGLVFLPDSLGYLVGTNCLGGLAYRLGRWRVAIVALLLVAVSCCLLPNARSMWGLVLPHVCLGLGIGAVDAALVPLLATLVDSVHSADYATVYAIQQTSVSLAYSLGPMLGGELVRVMGFPWLMRSIGLINLLYSPFLVYLAQNLTQESQPVAANVSVSYKSTESVKQYNRFINSDESD